MAVNSTKDINEQNIGEIDFMTMHFGPQHPGSGHFHASYKTDGEVVEELTPHPGYLHRGFEKLMEYRNHYQNAVLQDRVCILDPFPKELGYVVAAEQAAGVEAPERAKFIRSIMSEFGRLLSHFTWIGMSSMVTGLESGTKISWGDREKIMRLQEIITGGRIYPCYFMPGGVARDFPEGIEKQILDTLDYLEGEMKVFDDLVFFNTTFVNRWKGIAHLSKEDAIALGAVGPNLRASGVPSDVRKDEPYEAYPYIDFNVVSMEEGDAYTRALCRRQEIFESISIIRQLLDKMPGGDYRVKWPLNKKISPGDSYFCCEAARGELGYHMVTDGGAHPYRCKIRGPSVAHSLVLFPHLVKGHYIADIPVIYWSLDPCPADMDR